LLRSAHLNKMFPQPYSQSKICQKAIRDKKL